MTTPSLTGKRILVTQSEEFMGPELCAVLAGHGATVIADPRPLTDPAAPAAAVADAGHIDVLLANLAIPAPSTDALAVSEDEWRPVFASYLCSDAANCFVGQVFPVCGGWVAR
jgi:2-keto-3-deoxy-L-fuconate dehydrogenase